MPPTRRTALLTAAAFAAHPLTAAAEGTSITLRLLETSDLHTFDENYDYFRDTTDDTVGLTKVATLIAAARAGHKNTLLFDNGDIIQGNPLADYVAIPGNFPADRIHPTIRAMNVLKYDAATVGNHEFNYGLAFCTASLRGANFPFCNANILLADGTPYLPPTLLLERRFIADDGTPYPIKIGVIGFVTPQIVNWDKAHLAGRLTTLDIVDAARSHIPALRKNCDLLIALSHSGISTAPRRGGEENASYYLAQIPGIDIIFTGHSHRLFPGPDYAGIDDIDATIGTLGKTPAVMPGFWGSALGIIDLSLSRQNNAWTIASFACSTQEIATRSGAKIISLAANSPTIDAAIAPEHQKTLAWIRQPIGHLSQPITSYNALIGPDSSLALVNAAQSWYATPLLPADAQNLPILSAAAPFKEGYQSPDNFIDLASGTIAIKDVADLYMYPNTIVAVQIPGAALRDWLERSATVFNRIDPQNSAPQPLLNPHVPSYVFDVIAGLTYDIDITAPPRFTARGKLHPNAHRIQHLCHHATPITDDQQLIVITNNYRADASFLAQIPDAILLRAPDQIRDVIIRYVIATKQITVETPTIWRFAPIGAPVTVTFESAPAAARYLLKNPNIASFGDAGDGYTSYAMTLT